MENKSKKTRKITKRMCQRILLCCLVPISLFGISAHSMTSHSSYSQPVQQTEKASEVKINIEQAREIVQNRHGGTPIRIWLKELNGKKCYYVRILFPQGKVHTYAVDAQTGEEMVR